MNMLSRNADLQRIWIAKGTHGLMGTVWSSTQSVREYFSLRSTNKDLAAENLRLSKEVFRAQEMLRQARIDTMKMAARGRGFQYIGAEVIKKSRNKQHNYIVINRGFEDGIKEKSGVITPDGVVGVIDAVSAHHAFAFSFQNGDISIPARLGKDDGVVGPLVWDGIHSNKAILKEIPLHFKFEPGDTVYTSGYALMFPPDIPLGTIGKAHMVDGSTNEIDVTLFQDFSKIRYVTVVHNLSLEEIEEGSL